MDYIDHLALHHLRATPFQPNRVEIVSEVHLRQNSWLALASVAETLHCAFESKRCAIEATRVDPDVDELGDSKSSAIDFDETRRIIGLTVESPLSPVSSFGDLTGWTELQDDALHEDSPIAKGRKPRSSVRPDDLILPHRNASLV